LVGRAGEASITRYGPSVAHVSRQYLLHQHIRSLNANSDHARQQAQHCVWSITRHLLETIQARLLDLADLITDQPTTIHVSTPLSHRVGRDLLPLGGAQNLQATRGLLQLGIEAADAKPDQRCFHSVDNPSLFFDEALALAAGPLGIFVLARRDRHHLAVITLAAQPAEKGAFEQLGVEPVGLGASVLARYGYARCVNNVGLNAARPQPT